MRDDAPSRAVRWFVLGVIVATLGVVAPPARAQASGCDAVFPDATWVGRRSVGPVDVVGADMAVAELDRYAEEIRAFVDLMQPELGTLDGTAVCVFGDLVPLDPEEYVPRGQRIHALALTTEDVVVVEALDGGLVQRGAGFGLAYLALWNLADGPYPEPLGFAVGQWYVSRVEGKVELHHSVMSRASFFGGAFGTDWTAGGQSAVYSWNPQFQESPIGDIIDYAVATRGIGALTDPLSTDWADVEASWVAAMEDELLGESATTRGWMLGLAFFLGMITLAVAMALVARRNKRLKGDTRRMDTPVVG